ncbi:helix-turn-helix domain-containing protein [Streptomyces sp. NPDC055078]
MDQDMERLGAALKASRRARRPQMTQEGTATLLGVSRATVQNIERGTGPTKPNATVREYAQLLGWTPDSVDRVLAGGEPVLRHQEPEEAPRPKAVAQATPELPAVLRAELAEGQILAHGVYDLTEDGSSRMVVVAMGPEGATAEEITEFAHAWRQRQRGLRQLESGEEGHDEQGNPK